MKKTLIATASVAALFAMGGSALAGDLYAKGGYKDAPVLVAEPTWTGFYLGLGVGAAAVNHEIDLAGFVGLDGISATGVVGTVEVGYDRQFGNVVAGVFFNYDFGDNVSTDLTVLGTDLATVKQSDSWTVGGRLGYLVNTSTLAYVLGGYTESTFELEVPLFPRINGDDTFTGWTVGGGLETKLSSSLSLKAEYRYTEFDTKTYFNFVDIDTSVQTARLVLSYKADLFGGELPVPLK
ncbi:porin family protein [Rhodomicrobium vannielii ATCC 17100]|uniref:outer membrane protein n=1 Tax=Rhodomicrobium vannielii TaxID=1069 RepID=UPI001917C6D0|nr:outer membrane beta-barrel protein [Rhodomicrobium vannielii]MBJ7535122.1 porin family protein [Rhodomicrobium vannielii ATCC 17100]